MLRFGGLQRSSLPRRAVQMVVIGGFAASVGGATAYLWKQPDSPFAAASALIRSQTPLVRRIGCESCRLLFHLRLPSDELTWSVFGALLPLAEVPALQSSVSSTLLAILVRRQELGDKMLLNGLGTALCQLIDSEQPAVRRRVAAAVEELSKSPATQKHLMTSVGIANFTSLHSGSRRVDDRIRPALEALDGAVDDPDVARSIAESVEFIKQCGTAKLSDETLRVLLRAVAAACTRHPKAAAKFVAGGGLAAIAEYARMPQTIRDALIVAANATGSSLVQLDEKTAGRWIESAAGERQRYQHVADGTCRRIATVALANILLVSPARVKLEDEVWESVAVDASRLDEQEDSLLFAAIVHSAAVPEKLFRRTIRLVDLQRIVTLASGASAQKSANLALVIDSLADAAGSKAMAGKLVPNWQAICALARIPALQTVVVRLVANLVASPSSASNAQPPSEVLGLLSKLTRSANAQTSSHACRALASITAATIGGPKYAEGVHLLAAPAQPLYDIVFIHGVEGHPLTTWAAGDDYTVAWPRDWLPKELKEARVLSLTYSGSSISHWWGEGRSLVEHSEDLMYRLALANVGCRPVVFVTHSFGGLLVKQLLAVTAKTSVIGNELIDNTRGVVFFSTPHKGASIAAYGDNIIFRRTKTLEELRPGSLQLELLNSEFPPHIATLSFGENDRTCLGPSYGCIQLVSDDSTNPNLPGEHHRFHKLDSNHLGVCKPESTSAVQYKMVVAFIKSVNGR